MKPSDETKGREVRTVKPDGKKIVSLRLERGWGQEELAKKAECSIKTVARIEAGRPVFVSTLWGIATAFKVKCHELLLGAPVDERDDGHYVHTPDRMPYTVIVLAHKFSDFDQTELPRIMQEIVNKCNLQYFISVFPPQGGSTRIPLLLDDRDLLKLIQEYIDGELTEFGIERIEIVNKRYVLADVPRTERQLLEGHEEANEEDHLE
jgi:transcriptional regulator with XRE-family HTH domain